MKDLIILGNGMAGMTAALYAARAGLDFKLVGRDEMILEGARRNGGFPPVRDIQCIVAPAWRTPYPAAPPGCGGCPGGRDMHRRKGLFPPQGRRFPELPQMSMIPHGRGTAVPNRCLCR